jgi:hypothetical protein
MEHENYPPTNISERPKMGFSLNLPPPGRRLGRTVIRLASFETDSGTEVHLTSKYSVEVINSNDKPPRHSGRIAPASRKKLSGKVIEVKVTGDRKESSQIGVVLYPRAKDPGKGLSAEQIDAVVNATRTIGLRRAKIPGL